MMSNAIIEDKEVSWNASDIPVIGTRTAPKSEEARSVVILIGLGGVKLTDRNWCSPLPPGQIGTGRSTGRKSSR